LSYGTRNKAAVAGAMWESSTIARVFKYENILLVYNENPKYMLDIINMG
jgi:hypothetical protein